jgi:hypothetical protein
MSRSLQELILAEAALYLEPLAGVAVSDGRREALFAGIGWDLEAIPGLPVGELNGAIGRVAAARQVIVAAIASPPETLEEIATGLGTVADAVEAVQSLAAIFDAAGVPRPPQFEQIGSDLISFLAVEYLRVYHPRTRALLELLTLIEPEDDVPPSPAVRFGPDSALVRFPHRRARLRLDRLKHLLTDPAAALKAEYIGTNPLGSDDDARAVTDRLFPRLAHWLSTMGLDVLYGLKPAYGLDLGTAGNQLAAGMLTFYKAFDPAPDSARAGVGVTLALSPADRGDLGLVVTPFGDLTLTRTVGSWLLDLACTGNLEGFAISPQGLTLPSTGPATISGRLVAARLTDSTGFAFLVGSTSGTRLEVGGFQLTTEASLDAASQDYGFLVEAVSAAIVIAAGDGDGFLQRILPREGFRTTFELALGWAKGRGLYFRGSAGLEANLPIGQDLFSVLRVETMYLALRPDGDAIRAAVAASVTVQLGPVSAAVERVGLEATLTFPPAGGNVGPADLAVAFKPPDGAGLKIDSGVVVGGGYLLFDPAKEQYAGAVQLEVAGKLSLTAFGLLTTRMPDGSLGFSLLVLIAAEFSPPVQLGYGFTLSGVGGLFGVNRTVAVDVLRVGLRAGTLGSVLFPRDPIRNAPQIVSDLQAVFPPAEGRYVFGPVARLGWGTPTVLTIELGLLLELPAPVRLFLLGRLRVLLPEERAPVVRLQLDALGVIDFETGDVALDAVLFDSQVAQFAVTGEMALRANFGNNPGFVLAVGGFSPRFPAPPAFPALERVAISLATGNNPRLRLEAYLALTTNTVQFGARLELFAEIKPFSIGGYLGFDALLQFDPFGFVVDLGADVALKYRGKSVMSVALQMTLTGPTPWHAVGRARFKVLFMSGSVAFDVRLGQPEPPPLPAPVDVRPLLLAALREPGNWAAPLPPTEHPLVSFRDQPATADVLVHPLSDLQVSQRVVPLGVEIAHYGNTTPAGERQFTLGVVGDDSRLRTRPEEGVLPMTDFFAPGQFFALSDDEKLAAPAFERLPSGVRFTAPGFTCGAAVVEPDIRYERRTVREDISGTRAPAVARAEGVPGEESAPYILSAALLERVAGLGAAGQAPMSRTGTAKYRQPAAAGRGVTGFALREPGFVAVEVAADGSDTLRTFSPSPEAPPSVGAVGRGAVSTDPSAPTPVGGAPLSYTAATARLRRRRAAHPEERRRLRVVPAYVARMAARREAIPEVSR